ncbi:MAG: DinB family protein, partial [Acidobacteriaceae bacterium]|nr:DinB family protein [Acidobacteriaceae bacterium]
YAQPPAGLAGEVKQAYNSVKNNILKSAEKMPEDAYGFKPTADIRSFAEALDHVADSQLRTCAAVAGDQKTPNAAGKTAKADVIAALNDSFAECDKAYDSLTDANASETIKTPRGQRTRLGSLVANTTHDNEQYGIMTVYMRLKGVVPPSSERPMGK